LPPFYFQFSFDFADPVIQFGGYRFAFRIFTPSNVYGLDPGALQVQQTPAGVKIIAEGLTWAGGQERCSGRFEACLDRTDDGAIEWQASAWHSEPVKSIAALVDGLPLGRGAPCQQGFLDGEPREILFCYPPVHPYYGEMLYSPLLLLEAAAGDYCYIHCLDNIVRPKRFYLRPQGDSYHAEFIAEERAYAWNPVFHAPRWRIARCHEPAEAYRVHQAIVQDAHRLVRWEKRKDVPDWARDLRLSLALHGTHWTGYIFNTYEQMGQVLAWVARRIDPRQVLVYLPGWDGRYYWNYPAYEPDPRCGGKEGFKQLSDQAHDLGFHLMPMFGMNIANAKRPEFPRLEKAMARFPDGSPYWANWIDWDNDRSLETWMAMLNVGARPWRSWLVERISQIVQEYHMDAVFLDISLFWLNDPRYDMFTGTKALVRQLRRRFPEILMAGEAWYDAVLGLFPLCQATPPPLYPEFITRYVRAVAHLRHPAPGRGSTGVHEQGLRGFNTQTLELNPTQIPTLTVVDDTFEQHRDIMEAIIDHANRQSRS